MTLNRITLLRLSALATALLALAVPLLGALFLPDYSHLADTISELGAFGTPTRNWVNYAGFLPIGLLVLVFVVLASPLLGNNRRAKVGLYMLLGIAVGYLGAVLAPCDTGCPAVGTTRQAIHNSLGLIEYLGGGIGLILFSRAYFRERKQRFGHVFLVSAGILTLLALLLMMAPLNPDHLGLNQRIAELCLFSSLVVIAWILPQTSPGQDKPGNDTQVPG
ncbi:MAG: DUF998 domain-containing protein [Gammaproteobacteria bacterium]